MRLTKHLRLSRFTLGGLLLAASLFTGNRAYALSYPSASGYWTFAAYTSTWGNDQALSSGDVAASYPVLWYSLGSYNDAFDSYSICNRTGQSHTYTVYLYREPNYGDEFEADTVTVDDDSCVVVNISETNVTSSVLVQQL
jgi:hypothetical protein